MLAAFADPFFSTIYVYTHPSPSTLQAPKYLVRSVKKTYLKPQMKYVILFRDGLMGMGGKKPEREKETKEKIPV